MTFQRLRLGFTAFLVACLMIGLANLSHAQTYTVGSIAGTVFDATGAVVANASVTIRSDSTNAEYKLTSSESGFYKAAQLQPDTYTVTVQAPGFSAYRAVNVMVNVGQTTDVSPRMTAGSTSDTVEVTAEAPIMNYESPSIASILTTMPIQNLPLNGRWSNLVLLTPGTTIDSSGFGLISFRGISTLLNNVEIDGADNNQAYFSEERGRTRVGYTSSKYMIAEFQVNAGVYSAEFGRAAGGVVNAVTKSGGNKIHGIAYFSDRDNTWGAYNAFTVNTVNQGTVSSPNFVTSSYKPKDWRKEWGFSAGGPLIKDKLFWQYAYAHYRRNFPGTSKPASSGDFFSTPDMAEPSGYKCNLTGANAGLLVLTGTTTAHTSTVDQMACQLAARMSAAGNVAGVSSYATAASAYVAQLGNLLTDMGAVDRQGTQVINTPKIDWQVTPKQRLSFLFHRLRWDSPGGVQTQATNTYSVDGFGNDYVKLDYGLAKLNTTINDHIVNEIRYQYGRELNYESQQQLSDYTKKYLQGNNGITSSSVFSLSPNVPTVELANPSTGSGIYLGSPYYSYRKSYPDEYKWQIGDTVSWQLRSHSLKFGVDLLHNYDLMENTYKSNGYYTYSYIGNYFADLLMEGKGRGACEESTATSVTAPGKTGVSSAGYTGANPCGTFQQGFGPSTWDISTMDYGFFVEDHWKVTPRLTIDMGVRYDYESLPAPYSSLITATGSFTPYTAATNGLCSTFPRSGVAGSTCPALAAAADLTNKPDDKNNIGPRVGLAWDPYGDGKTTVRAGYGIFFGRINNGTALQTYLNSASPNGQYTSSSYLPTSTSGRPLFPNILAASATPSGPTSYFFSKGFQNPQVHEFDLAVQRDLGKGTVMQISYIGALGRQLPNGININLNPNANTAVKSSSVTAPNGVVQALITVSDSSGEGPLKNGATYLAPSYIKPSSKETTGNLINSNFGPVIMQTSDINSSYHGGVIEVLNRTNKYVTFDANYTWSRAMDYNQNSSTAQMSNGYLDPYDIDGFGRRANYGRSSFNLPHRFVGWAQINTPNLKTKQWVKYLTNDWSLNPSFQVQSGRPYSLSLSSSAYSSAHSYSYGWNGSGVSSWIPVVGYNTYQMPYTMNTDLRVEKSVKVGVGDQSYKLRLSGEAFNILNRQNVTTISTAGYSLTSSSTCSASQAALNNGFAECATLAYIPKTGSGTSAKGFQAVTNTNSNFAYSPRQIQLSVRLEF